MKNIKLKLVMLFILACSFIFTNCPFSEKIEYDNMFDIKTFYRKWAAWEEQGITYYSVNLYRRSMSAIDDFQMIVNDNIVIQTEPSDRGRYLEERTISEIYGWVYRFFKQNISLGGRVETFKIIYNDEFHFPEYIEILIPAEKPISPGAGAWIIIQLSEFTPLTSAEEE